MRDSELADRVARVVDGERAFWHDDAQRYFLVGLLPLTAPAGWSSATGTGLTQSFAAFVSNGRPLEELDSLWIHEYFHNWNSTALGRLEEPEARMYWFSEGFTDYYTDLLPLRWGTRKLDDYAKGYDAKLKALAESPVAHLANDDIPARFFTNQAVARLPYLRGQLLAAQWDDLIRTVSGGRRSLDDVMRALRDEHARGADILDVRRIVARARAAGVVDPQGDIDRQILRGEAPRFADGALTPCIAIVDRVEPRFDWGFDFDRTVQGHPVSGVRAEGPAYAAGMRDGQWLRTAKLIRTDETLAEVGVQNLPDETVHVLQYRPTGALLTRRAASLKPGLSDAERKACLGRLGVPRSTEVPSSLPANPHP